MLCVSWKENHWCVHHLGTGSHCKRFQFLPWYRVEANARIRCIPNKDRLTSLSHHFPYFSRISIIMIQEGTKMVSSKMQGVDCRFELQEVQPLMIALEASSRYRTGFPLTNPMRNCLLCKGKRRNENSVKWWYVEKTCTLKGRIALEQLDELAVECMNILELPTIFAVIGAIYGSAFNRDLSSFETNSEKSLCWSLMSLKGPLPRNEHISNDRRKWIWKPLRIDWQVTSVPTYTPNGRLCRSSPVIPSDL